MTDDNLKGSYLLTRIVFLRVLGFIYCVAFSVAFFQNEALIGEKGLTPAALYLGSKYKISRAITLPTKSSIYCLGRVLDTKCGGNNWKCFWMMPTLFW